MNKAYIVTGNCGSYDDATAWNVKAFLNKKEADKFCEKLMQAKYDVDTLDRDELMEALKEAGDVNIYSVDTDVSYSVEEVTLE